MTRGKGHINGAFDGTTENMSNVQIQYASKTTKFESKTKNVDVEKNSGSKERPNWTNQTEFLMSCIATSVGLGNVWRFPFTAFENGGGAFLIPYIIVLFIIGKPMYYLEMIMGQFTSKSSIKIWEICPGFRGVGIGQLVGTVCVITYYCSLIALTVYYFFASFSLELPWSTCLESWGSDCVDSLPKGNEATFNSNQSADILRASSSELYFLNTVLHEKQDISDGIGYPSLKLTGCLLVSWIIVFLIIVKGVKSSGKASYFLALFPYVVMLALLIRAVTLEGSMNGIIYFIKPQWDQLLSAKIWYAATTQVFYSLSVSIGTIVMFASYNQFNHNIHRDALIVTTLDTFTSMLAGITIFGILGNLAHNMGIEDIGSVVKSGTGLAFISYPDAITKLKFLPQVFSVLFFFMLFVLGIGSVVALQNVVVTVLCDQFSSLRYWKVAAITSVIGFCSGLMYITPGGQWMLNLVDHFGGTLLIFLCGIFELTGIAWVYGIDNFCMDVEFMTGRRVSLYWRVCWLCLAPLLMITVFIYSLATLKPLTYAGLNYPTGYIEAGWCIFIIGGSQIPLWAIWTFCHKTNLSFCDAIKKTFSPSKRWGPNNEIHRAEWIKYKEEVRQRRALIVASSNHSYWRQKLNIFLGKY